MYSIYIEYLQLQARDTPMSNGSRWENNTILRMKLELTELTTKKEYNTPQRVVRTVHGDRRPKRK